MALRWPAVRRFAFVVCTLALIALGGVLMANQPPDLPPTPPPPAGPAVTIIHRVLIRESPVSAMAEVDWTIYDMTDDGEPAIMTDPITGTAITAPDFGRAPVPFEYHDTLGPGVVYSEAQFIVTGVPLGAWLICETLDAAGNRLDDDAQQQTTAGAVMTVRCIYSKPA